MCAKICIFWKLFYRFTHWLIFWIGKSSQFSNVCVNTENHLAFKFGVFGNLLGISPPSFVVHFDYFFIYYLKCVIGSEGIKLAEYIGSNPRLRKLIANVFFLFHAHAKPSTQIAIYVVQ